MGRTISKTIEDVNAALDALDGRFRVHSRRAAPPAEAEIAAAERRMGTKLAPHHRLLVAEWGALRIEPTAGGGAALLVHGIGVAAELDAEAHWGALVKKDVGRMLVPALGRSDSARVICVAPAGTMMELPDEELDVRGAFFDALLERLAALGEAAGAKGRGKGKAAQVALPAAKPRLERPKAPPAKAGKRTAALKKAMGGKDGDALEEALDELSGWPEAAALDDLLGLIKKDKWPKDATRDVILAQALIAAAACGPTDPRVVTALLAHIDEDYSLASDAFGQLAAMGEDAAAAVPALTKCAAKGDPWHVANAHFALAAITGDLETHVPPIILAMVDKEIATRATAEIALKELSTPVVPFLRASLAHGRSAALRKRAGELLNQLGGAP